MKRTTGKNDVATTVHGWSEEKNSLYDFGCSREYRLSGFR